MANSVSVNRMIKMDFELIHESLEEDFVNTLLSAYLQYASVMDVCYVTNWYDAGDIHFGDFFAEALILGKESLIRKDIDKSKWDKITEKEEEDYTMFVANHSDWFERELMNDLMIVFNTHQLFYVKAEEQWHAGPDSITSMFILCKENSPLQEVW